MHAAANLYMTPDRLRGEGSRLIFVKYIAPQDIQVADGQKGFLGQ